jgi:hypothetical protein
VALSGGGNGGGAQCAPRWQALRDFLCRAAACAGSQVHEIVMKWKAPFDSSLHDLETTVVCECLRTKLRGVQAGAGGEGPAEETRGGGGG